MQRLVLLLLLAFLMEGCKKYEEGPAFSLRSRKERLSASWGVKQYFLNGNDKTDSFLLAFKGYEFGIIRSGAYSISFLNSSNQPVSESGAWKFTDGDKAFEILSGVQFAVPQKYHILRLKEKELWCYREIMAGKKEEFHFKPQ